MSRPAERQPGSDWATDIFPIESRTERSGFVRRIWRAPSVALPSFISVAVPTWQIVFIQSADGSKSVVARGPETLATRVDIPKDVEFLGIQFELGAFLPDNTVARLVDNAESLPVDPD